MAGGAEVFVMSHDGWVCSISAYGGCFIKGSGRVGVGWVHVDGVSASPNVLHESCERQDCCLSLLFRGLYLGGG